MSHLINTAAAALFAALFFGVAYLADRNLQDGAKLDAIDAHLLAAEHRAQRAARALCIAELGPGAKALWTQDGDLVCRPALLTAQARP